MITPIAYYLPAAVNHCREYIHEITILSNHPAPIDCFVTKYLPITHNALSPAQHQAIQNLHAQVHAVYGLQQANQFLAAVLTNAYTATFHHPDNFSHTVTVHGHLPNVIGYRVAFPNAHNDGFKALLAWRDLLLTNAAHPSQ